MAGLLDSILRILITISQILTAGIAITAFALLQYALTFNLRDRVARSFAIILTCLVVLFSADAFGSTSQSVSSIGFWLNVQWIAIILLPASYLNFSDALLSTTGKPSRWRRRWAIRLAALISAAFLVLLITGKFSGPVVTENTIVPHTGSTLPTEAFTIFYLVVMGMSWFNFIRAYQRTLTHTSQRRMLYLIISALGPAVGSFPFLLYGSSFAVNTPIIFWFVTIGTNVILALALVALAYSVAFFGVSWPDRLVKSRLFKWLLRGPVTASLTLALVTIIRRAGELATNNPYSAFVPISMVVSILLCEYLITIFYPYIESWLFFGKDVQELEGLRSLEEKLITRSDLRQFLEMVLASVCDRLQARGAYLAGIAPDGLEIMGEMGTSKVSDNKLLALDAFVRENQVTGFTAWQGDGIYPIMNGSGQPEPIVEGYLGIEGFGMENLDADDISALHLLSQRAAIALKDHDAQEQIFRSLEMISPQVDLIQQLRAAGRYDRNGLMKSEGSLRQEEMAQWIKEALTHYWGGPKLTESPLMELQVVQDILPEHENNPQNALRSILRTAIEQTRPEGERKYTSEWILYNILDLKFMEGKRVREIARRLAISEADLYRKQRVAVEAITNNIVQMELKALEMKKGTVG